MIPTPQRIRANRIWSAAMAVASAGAFAAVGWAASPDRPAVFYAMLIAGLLAGGTVYVLGTRSMRRRARALEAPIPPAWQAILARRCAYFAGLPPPEQQRLLRLAAVFLAETPIRAVGCELSDTVRLLVAASAVIPAFALAAWEYRALREVVIRGDEFEVDYPDEGDDMALEPEEDPMMGMVGHAGDAFSGTLVLSRRDLLRGYRSAGRHENVGIHEFVHLMDEAGVLADPQAASGSDDDRRPWLPLARREIASPSDGWSDMPDYAFSDIDEFLPVAAEYFFTAPHELAWRHRELFEMLRRAFGQDPRQHLKARQAPSAKRRRKPRR